MVLLFIGISGCATTAHNPGAAAASAPPATILAPDADYELVLGALQRQRQRMEKLQAGVDALRRQVKDRASQR